MSKPSIYTKEMMERFTKSGYWGKVSISDFWKKNAKEIPNKEAMVDGNRRLTWAEAAKLMDRLALALLETGLKKDDVVVLQLPNNIELMLLRLACERAGLLHLPAQRTMRDTEMLHVLKQSEAKAIVVPWKYRNFDYIEMLKELKPQLPNLKYIIVWGDEVPKGILSLKEMMTNPIESKYKPDYLESKKIKPMEVSLIALTTGTTGLPKLVEWPSCALVICGLLIKNLGMTGNDITGSFTAAVLGPNAPAFCVGVQVGAKIVFLEHWTIEDGLKLIEKEKITLPCIVPTQLAEMMAYPGLDKYDLSSIRAVRSAGAPIPYSVARASEEKFGFRIQNGYGASDFGSICETSIDDPPEVRLLTAGVPMPGFEVQLRDSTGKEVPKGSIGEVFARAMCSASGYFKDPETTAQMWTKDGWYRTGDLGRFDEGGHMLVVGREKDMILRGGQNIFPAEVENLLLTHPCVADASIVAIPDSIMGERACACVVTKQGKSITLEEMVSFLKGKKIAPYKLPEKLVILKSLPYVSGVKLDKKALQAQTAEDLKKKGELA